MDFKKAKKHCLCCNKQLKLKNNRDVNRKKYCSFSCRQKYRFVLEQWDMNRLWSKSNTPEVNAKKARKLHENWKYKPNREEVKFRRRPETNEFKRIVFDRDGHKCVICGSTKSLVADHIVPYCESKDLRYVPENGRTLCTPCHRKTDTYGWRMVNKLKRKKNATISK